MNFLGIDPGKSGGICLLTPKTIEYVHMPTTELDIWNWFKALDPREEYVAIIEHVTVSPQMGVVSAGTFMGNYMQLRMALTASAIPFEPIRPQVWQAGLKIPPRKSKRENDRQFKERLRQKAQQLFPKLPLWTMERSKGFQLAVCDAILIAEYCRRTKAFPSRTSKLLKTSKKRHRRPEK